MNIYELDQVIETLKNEKLASNKSLIDFYETKRKELIVEINEKISKIL